MKQADEMREQFARWRGSGQSLMAFSKAEGVSYQKLLYWRRKLEGRVRKRELGAKGSELVPIKVVDESSRVVTQESKFEIWLSNGVSLDVAAGFDASELRRLIGVLLSC